MRKSFIIQVPLETKVTVRIKVNVYTDRAAYIKGTKDQDSLGLCQRYWAEDPEGKLLIHNRQVSTIHLIEGHLGAGIVSHESAHAAVHLWTLMSDDGLSTENDEPFAWVLGDITRKIYNGLYRLKIL